jgi:ubiquinone/menaquinone biosynthesis C-methylase UbiE
MAEQQPIHFDGLAYERLMGVWSQAVGTIFLDWLSPAPGQRWIDVGCGNGAFTEQVVQRCQPQEIYGIDPSEGQLAYARARQGAKGAVFQRGDATALPYENDRFDAAVMALVIAFVQDPAKGVAEMARVVSAGGFVATYVWDTPGGGSPLTTIIEEVTALGIVPSRPPSDWASGKDALHDLWAKAGLERIDAKTISVRRDFRDFDEFWKVNTATGPVKATIDRMEKHKIENLHRRVQTRLSPGGRAFTVEAWANAIKGVVPEIGKKHQEIRSQLAWGFDSPGGHVALGLG